MDQPQAVKIPDPKPGTIRVVVDFNVANGDIAWYTPPGVHPALVIGPLVMAATHVAMATPKKSPLAL